MHHLHTKEGQLDTLHIGNLSYLYKGKILLVANITERYKRVRQRLSNNDFGKFLIIIITIVLTTVVENIFDFPAIFLNRLWVLIRLIPDENSWGADFISSVVFAFFIYLVTTSIYYSLKSKTFFQDKDNIKWHLWIFIPLWVFLFFFGFFLIIFSKVSKEKADLIFSMESLNETMSAELVSSDELCQATINSQSTQIAMLTTTLTPIPNINEQIKNQIRDYFSYLSNPSKRVEVWEKFLDFEYQRYWESQYTDAIAGFVAGWKDVLVKTVELNEPKIDGDLAEIIGTFKYSKNLENRTGQEKICLRFNTEKGEWLIYRHLPDYSRECSFDYYN